MIGRFGYKFLGKFPHLSKAETLIWNRFIEKYPDFCDRVDYDVIVGSGPRPSKDLSQEWENNAHYLGSYKIDVVGYKDDIIYIFELKQRAGPSAIGQLFTYMLLYQEQMAKGKEVEPVLITNQERPDMRKICNEHDIDYYLV